MKNIFAELFNRNTSAQDELQDQKRAIRQKIRHRKQHITTTEMQESAERVFEKIENMDEFKNAKKILLYWSMPDELNTHAFIVKWAKDKQILLPVVKENDMLVQPFSTKNDLKQGKFGIWEPEIQKEYISDIDLVIVPGVAFDRYKSRLGRGKGYYDKYFVMNKIKKIGIGYDFQLVDNVPTANYDIKMDIIITPNHTII